VITLRQLFAFTGDTAWRYTRWRYGVLISTMKIQQR